MNEAIGLTRHAVRARCGHLLPRLLPARGAEQRRALPLRRARLDLAHHDHVGARLGGDGLAVGPNSFYLLRAAAGRRRGRLLPRRRLLPRPPGFPSEYRTRIIAWFMVAIPISSVIGGPVSGLLLAHGWLRAWPAGSGSFIVEGLPAVFVGSSCLWLLADRPEDAAWLTRRGDGGSCASGSRAERRPKEVKRLALAVPRRARADPGGHAVRVSRWVVRHRHLPAADPRHRLADRTCRSASSRAGATPWPASA